MSLIESLIKVCLSNGIKIVLYPLMLSFASSILIGLIVGKIPEVYSLPLYALLFGVLIALLSKIFGVNLVIMPSFLLTVALIIIALLALFGGLYFGSLFIPIVIANIIFALCLFVVDSSCYGGSIKDGSIIFYFFAGLLAALFFYLFIMVDWKTNVSWLYLCLYSITIYSYVQISLIGRLVFIIRNS